MVYVAILGHGVVGSGVAEVLRKNADSIAHKAGEPIEIRRILDLREFPDLPYADKFTKEFDDILHDPDIRIVVETMGGLHPAYDFVKSCLLAGKNVVTSNKELVAAKGDELLEIAKNNNLNFLFEASVGGGIPILRPIDQCLAANEVYEIAGILNGTTNFMLTRMIEDHMSFEDALALAQKLGYAERNPSADVDGHDACRKICILSDLAYGDKFDPDKVSCEGITKITLEDVANADKLGCVIKLLGRSVRCEDGTAYAYVAPHLIHKESPLAAVEDVFNAIMIDGNATGEVMFYGKGAGKLATASAVVADMLDSIEHKDNRRRIFWGDGSKNLLRPLDTLQSAWYVRFKGAQKDVEELLPVESLTEPAEGVFVVQTRKLSTAEMNAAAEKLNARGEVRAAMRIL